MLKMGSENFPLLQILLLVAMQLIAFTSGAKKTPLHTNEKRQAGSFGFQHNILPSSSPGDVGGGGGMYYPGLPSSGVGGHYYDPVRGNGLGSSSNLRNDYDYRERDRDYYYPSASTYGGSGRSSYNPNRNDFRDPYPYNNRDHLRQPYYDDYNSRYQNGYQSARDREAAAAQHQEFMMRSGQQRHAEYQKRVGHSGGGGQGDSYDPFYFIGINRNGGNIKDGLEPSLTPLYDGPSRSSLSSSFIPPPSPSSTLTGTGGSLLLSPSTTSSGSGSGRDKEDPNGGPLFQNQKAAPNPPALRSSGSASHPLRNRRNSHSNHPNDISGDKYEIMSAKRDNKNRHDDRDRDHDHPPTRHHHHQHHQHNQHLDRQFLTREQLIRQHPDSRVNYPQYHLERNSNGPILAASGQPWSVRIGTQLKVNDDGRAPNPHRFYVRDEVNPGRNRSRYPGPIYRRK